MFKKTVISFILSGLILAPLSFDLKSINFSRAETKAPYTINGNTVWDLAGSPYIISSDVFISEGAVLTIQAGVIVKFGSGAGMTVEGNLIANGAEDNPIIFTSLKDNTGGDQNPRSDLPPKKGDWASIYIMQGGSASLNNATVRYGGYFEVYQTKNNIIKQNTAMAGFSAIGAIAVDGGTANIDNSILTENIIAMESYSGTANIYNSKIFNNQTGINNYSTSQIDATNNFWGDDSGPYHETLNSAGLGNAVVGDVLFSPWIGQAPKKLEPVILIPGIMGSWNLGGEWQLDPILNTYDNLWEALKLAGYIEGENLFAFPYQWRLSNVYTAGLLKEKINAVKEICDCDKVDLVAHSMGGLVARSYIQSKEYKNDVDQLIFLATPHKGATKAYLTWEGGEFGPKPKDKIQQRIFTLEAEGNGYGSVFQYVRGLPMQSAQELLPIYDYLRDSETMGMRAYPDNYPINTFLELLNNPSQMSNLAGVDITNILADAGAESTINILRVENKDSVWGEWEHGYPENYSMPFTDHGMEYGAGDITVPEKSNKDFMGKENIVIASDHNDIVTDAQKRAIKELTGVEPTEEIRMNMFKKYLLIRIFSPADFVITAPDGKKLGKDFANGQILNNIPNAFYSGFAGDIEFAVIPDPLPGDYGVELEGTGNGEYTLSASFISDEEDVDKNYTGNITAGATENFDFVYSDTGEGDPLGELEPEAAKTIAEAISHIEEIYAKGWITKKISKNLLVKRLEHLENRLENLQKQKEKIANKIEKINSDNKLKPKAKEKRLAALNKQLEEIEKNRQKAIDHDLELLEKRLNIIKKKNRINSQGYDIIIKDVNSLKINL
jgi:pimeloyl-ACP methyl ester carboxylesterase